MYRRQPHGFKTRLSGRGFHILVRNTSFPSPTDVGSHSACVRVVDTPYLSVCSFLLFSVSPHFAEFVRLFSFELKTVLASSEDCWWEYGIDRENDF